MKRASVVKRLLVDWRDASTKIAAEGRHVTDGETKEIVTPLLDLLAQKVAWLDLVLPEEHDAAVKLKARVAAVQAGCWDDATAADTVPPCQLYESLSGLADWTAAIAEFGNADSEEAFKVVDAGVKATEAALRNFASMAGRGWTDVARIFF